MKMGTGVAVLDPPLTARDLSEALHVTYGTDGPLTVSATHCIKYGRDFGWMRDDDTLVGRIAVYVRNTETGEHQFAVLMDGNTIEIGCDDD